MGRRRRPRRAARRLVVLGALTVAGVAALPVGLAQMASNDVPATRAGQADAPVEVGTRLVVAGPDASGLLTAELSTDDRPLSGVPVDFALSTSPGAPVCDGALTDASGVATCDPGVAIEPLAGSSTGATVTWVATFSGLGALLAATDTVETAVAEVPDPPVDPSPTPSVSPAPDQPDPTQPSEPAQPSEPSQPSQPSAPPDRASTPTPTPDAALERTLDPAPDAEAP